MRGLTQFRSAARIAAGHAFVHNLRRGHYELAADVPPPLRLPADSASSRWRCDRRFSAPDACPGTLDATDPLASAGLRWEVAELENRLRWVRDVTLGEDLHQARTRNGLRVMATLRNLVISLLRFAGHSNIARALRMHARHPERAITLLTSANTTSQ
jgi:hypothetical protein